MTQLIETEHLNAYPRSPPSGKITYEAFLDWLDEDTWAEWVDGEVVMMSPVGDIHQDLLVWLVAVLRFYTDVYQLGAIRCEPFQMKTAPELPSRAPDLLFVAEAHRSRLQKSLLDGPADLVIEIVSPESRSRDRGDKFYEYEQGGVLEYWLLDQPRKQAEFFQLGQDGLYRAAPIVEGVFHSAVLTGLWLRTEWLWQEPLPLVPTVLQDWGLIPRS